MWIRTVLAGNEWAITHRIAPSRTRGGGRISHRLCPCAWAGPWPDRGDSLKSSSNGMCWRSWWNWSASWISSDPAGVRQSLLPNTSSIRLSR